MPSSLCLRSLCRRRHCPRPAHALHPPAQAAQQPKGPTSFINDVAPILKENCFACHDAKKRKGNLDMTTFENFHKGGDKDDPFTAGKPDESLILDVLTAKDNSRMPPKDSGEPLPPAEDRHHPAVDQGRGQARCRPDAEVRPAPRVAGPLEAARAAGRLQVPRHRHGPGLHAGQQASSSVGGHHELTVWDVASGKLEKRIAHAGGAGLWHGLPAGWQAGGRGRPARARRRRPHL